MKLTPVSMIKALRWPKDQLVAKSSLKPVIHAAPNHQCFTYLHAYLLTTIQCEEIHFQILTGPIQVKFGRLCSAKNLYLLSVETQRCSVATQDWMSVCDPSC